MILVSSSPGQSGSPSDINTHSFIKVLICTNCGIQVVKETYDHNFRD